MNMTMPGRKSLASLPLLPLALLVSLLFSLLLALTNPLLNDDAFTYIKAAERFQQDGIDAVLQEYGWHAYSVLIALADASPRVKTPMTFYCKPTAAIWATDNSR